jgi:hypothetical protein
VSASATAPIGTLISKQLRQPSPSGSSAIRLPPISWPPAAAKPIVVP